VQPRTLPWNSGRQRILGQQKNVFWRKLNFPSPMLDNQIRAVIRNRVKNVFLVEATLIERFARISKNRITGRDEGRNPILMKSLLQNSIQQLSNTIAEIGIKNIRTERNSRSTRNKAGGACSPFPIQTGSLIWTRKTSY
jgi:hypothetical protein